MTKIAIDVDDVLADFSAEFIKFQKDNYDLDLEAVKDKLYRIDWVMASGLSVEEAQRRVNEFLETDNCRNLGIVNGAKEAVSELNKNFKLVALTGRPESVSDLTKDWLNKNFPGIFSGFLSTNAHLINKDGNNDKDKGEMCVENGIELLIDDFPQYCLECASVDIPTFLFNQPHNQYFNDKDYPEITRVNSWNNVLENLIK